MNLTRKQLEKLKEKINLEKSRVMSSFNDVSKENLQLNNDDRPDEVDQAASDYARSQLLRFRNRNLFYLKKLNKALEKFEENEYGVCEDCDAEIKFERLYARPTAELCISCKDEAEREENSSYTGRQSKSLGKTVNFINAI